MTKYSKCVVKFCGHCQQRDRGCIYAKFPKDIERCRAWLRVVGDTDLIYLPPAKLNETRYICGCHFTDDQFSNATRKRLNKKSVPSIIDNRIQPLNDDLVNQYPLSVDNVVPTSRNLVKVSKKIVMDDTGTVYSDMTVENGFSTKPTLIPAADGLSDNTDVPIINTYVNNGIHSGNESLTSSLSERIQENKNSVISPPLHESARGRDQTEAILRTSQQRIDSSTMMNSALRSDTISSESALDDRILKNHEEDDSNDVFGGNAFRKCRKIEPVDDLTYNEFGNYIARDLKIMNPILANNVMLEIRNIMKHCNDSKPS